MHESPRNITWVLWALAGAALLIGPLLGFPALISKLWHGEPVLETWLEPVTQFSKLTLVGDRAWKELPVVEGLFMLVSIGVASFGWFMAKSLYFDLAKTQARLDALKAQYRGIHSLVFDKYRVDELYAATVIRAFRGGASAMSWFDAHIVDGLVNLMGKITMVVAWINGAIDTYLVDGAVNFVAETVIGTGRQVRKVQTGRINHYLLAVTAGVVVIVLVAYFV